MAKSKKKTAKSALRLSESQQLDSVYVLKIVMYLMLGAQWIRVVDVSGTNRFPIPIGLIVGIFFAMHDHFQIDRKIEYAVLFVAMFVGFWSQIGIYITI